MSEVQCLKQELICYKKKLGDANREIQTLREQLQEAKKIMYAFSSAQVSSIVVLTIDAATAPASKRAASVGSRTFMH